MNLAVYYLCCLVFLGFGEVLDLFVSGVDVSLQRGKWLPAASWYNADIIRASTVRKIDGSSVPLGKVMGEGRAVVVFLRHLGCPYCWSYARQWCELQPAMKELEPPIAGPIFVTIGDESKLDLFLKRNPYISPDQIFLDDAACSTYKRMSLRRLGENPELAKDAINTLQPPTMPIRQFLGYLWTSTKLTALPKGTSIMDFLYNRDKVQGTLWLGGVYAVDGSNLVYTYEEALAGDHPPPEDVLEQFLDIK